MSILGEVNGKQHSFHKTLATLDPRFLAVAPSGVKTLLRLFARSADRQLFKTSRWGHC
jgi:hypothetical protein